MDLFAATLTPDEVMALPAFEEAVRLYLTPPPRVCLTGWHLLHEYLKRDVARAGRERVRVLYLDRRNQLISDEVTGHGTPSAAPLYPREVARRALELDASAVILTHNHPSGDPTPSQTDIHTTALVRDALKAVGVSLHDHVITGGADCLSMRAQGLI